MSLDRTRRTTTARRGPVARAALGIGAGALVAALLAGCASEPPTPRPDEAAAGPVLSEDQNTKVLAAVNETLGEAGKANDPEVLKRRLTGPALAVRSSQLKVAAARGNADLVTEIPNEYLGKIVPTTETWPRTSFAITVQTENLRTPRLLVLDQASARAPYKLWGWAELLPGVTLPAFADVELGSEAIAPDDDSLLLTPADAVAQYIDVLNLGGGSAFAATFADDDFRKLLASNAQVQSEALKAAEGTYTMQVAAMADQPVHAVRTADGGAMVVAALTATETMQGVEGSKIGPPTETLKTLFGSAEQTHVLKAGYTDVVALHLPAAGSEDQARLLGFSHVATSVSNQ
jgi:hypothetical protein